MIHLQRLLSNWPVFLAGNKCQYWLLLVFLQQFPQDALSASYYLCQSDTGKRYSEKPCLQHERSSQRALKSEVNEAERERLLEQTRKQQGLTQKWQQERIKQEAKYQRENEQVARRQEQKRHRCEQARLAHKLAEDELKQSQPKKEMVIRSKIARLQQKSDTACSD